MDIIKVTNSSRALWNRYIRQITAVWRTNGVGTPKLKIDLTELPMAEQARFMLELEKRWMAR